MKKSTAAAFRKGLASDLRRLSKILSSHQVCSDTSPIDRAASDCEHGPGRDGAYQWGYTMEWLVIQLPIQRHAHPANLNAFQLELRVVLEGECASLSTENPLNALAVDFRISAQTAEQNKVHFSWHLDRHLESDSKDAVHPDYHFQHAGHQLTNSIKLDSMATGEILFLDAPRLAHPPLDIILAIDLALSNFHFSKWIELRNDNPEYVNLLKTSQARLWKPYAMAIGKFGSGAVTPGWAPKAVWSQVA